jgi:hypothetical protein
MGLRFRKSVKLAPGIRMNFSGSGVSWTLGPRGASVSVGSRGAFLNAGIPGTGISSRTRLSSNAEPTETATMRMSVNITVEDNGQLVFRDAHGVPISQGLIDEARRQHGAAIAGLVRSACEKVNREVEALAEIHLESPSPCTRPTFQPLPFTQPEPQPPKIVPEGFWEKVFKWRKSAREERVRLALEAYESDFREWHAQRKAHADSEYARKKFLELDIFALEAAMEEQLEAALRNVQWPRETHVSFDVAPDGASVTLDVDLPEIEDMPARMASVPARGYRLAIKEMGSVQKRKVYMAHVHGVGFRVIAETFAALPTVQQITLSAYSQRKDKGTGHVGDDYLYSVRVRREDWLQINFQALGDVDVVEALGRFEMRRKMTGTGIFHPIEPYEPSQSAPSRPARL